MIKYMLVLLPVVLFIIIFCIIYIGLPLPADLTAIRQTVGTQLTRQLQTENLEYGSPIFIRIFKQTKELELWVLDGKTYELFKTYAICNYSGQLGPKLKEGDKQAPEGFYDVNSEDLNPDSRFHLSFNIGYPNIHDQMHDRTGSYIMVHGGCVSAGCFAIDQ